MQAIDMHMHVPRQPGLPDRPVDAQLREYFRSPPPPTVEDMANKYKELDILGVLFSVDTETTTGDRPDSNDYVADIVREYPISLSGSATWTLGRERLPSTRWSGVCGTWA